MEVGMIFTISTNTGFYPSNLLLIQHILSYMHNQLQHNYHVLPDLQVDPEPQGNMN